MVRFRTFSAQLMSSTQRKAGKLFLEEFEPGRGSNIQNPALPFTKNTTSFKLCSTASALKTVLVSREAHWRQSTTSRSVDDV